MPISGVEILKQISSSTYGEWKPSPGSIYFILNELNSRGLISQLQDSNSNVKKYITTNKGMDMLSNFLKVVNQIIKRQLVFVMIMTQIANNKKVKDLVEMALDRAEM
jgi:DNA-binding PadR family transcriptional regulator